MSKEEKRNINNAWKMLYNLMNNIKTHMDIVYEDKRGEISLSDVEESLDYISKSIDNILNNTVRSKNI